MMSLSHDTQCLAHLVLSEDPEATLMQSAEMETDQIYSE